VVQAGRNNWWLAPDHGDAWTGNCDLAGFQGCFLSADGSQRQYQVPGQMFACRWNLTVSPAEDGWQAVADLEYDGLATPVADPRQLAERMAGRILDDGELADFELRESSRRNLALRFRVEGTGLTTLQDGLGWYTMPWPDLDVVDEFLEGIDRSRAVRHTVLTLDHDASVDGSFTLELPSGWSVDSPGPRDVSYTEAPLTLEYRTEALSRGLKQVVHLSLAPGQVEADRWPAFRQAVTDVVDLSAEAVVIVTDR